MSAQERKGTQPGGSASPIGDSPWRKTISIAEGQKSVPNVLLRKSGDRTAPVANALRTTHSTLDQELARSAITSRNMRRLSRKKLTLLPSAWFQHTGT